MNQPPKFKSFFADLNNLILLGTLLVGCLVFVIYYYYQIGSSNGEYSKISAFKELKVSDLNQQKLDKESYVRLTDFCFDDNSCIWEITKNRKVQDVYTYITLNNQCDSINGPIVIVEMNKVITETYTNAANRNELIEKVLTGRFCKGYKNAHAPIGTLTNQLQFDESREIYTLIAGETPEKVKEKVMMNIYVAAGVAGLGIICFVIGIRSYNIKRKKNHLKQLKK